MPFVSIALPQKLALGTPEPIEQHKTRLVLAGLLAIFVGFGIHSWVKDDSPSLAWLLISCGIWGISTYLVPNVWIDSILRQMNWKVVRRSMGYAMVVTVSLIAVWALIAGIAAALEWEERNARNEIGGTMAIEEEDALRVYLSLNSLDVATKARAERLLADYRTQQKQAGLPMFPNVAQAHNVTTAALMVIDWDTWEMSLDSPRRQQLESIFRFETDKETARQRFAAVAYVSAATGADIEDVSKRFESWYMPAFAADTEKGFGRSEGVKDFGEFFGLLGQLVASKSFQ